MRRIVRRSTGWGLFLSAVLSAPPTAAQTIYYVDVDANGVLADGSSWENAFRNLQLALDAAAATSDSVELRIARGTYRPLRPGEVASTLATFSLPDGVALFGGYAGAGAPAPDERDPSAFPTILNGELATGIKSLHVVSVVNISGAGIFGVTISGGDGAGADGGGMFVDNSFVTVTSCVIESNRAVEGGGIAAINGAEVFVELSELRFNRSGFAGGAAYTNASTLIFEQCVIRNNPTDFSAGAIYSLGGSAVMLTDCQVLAHNGQFGGAIRSQEAGTLTLINCHFMDNRRGGIGGAIWTSNGTETVVDGCWFEDNFTSGSTGGGGAIYASGSSDDRCALTVRNSTFLGNAHFDTTNLGRGGAIWASRADVRIRSSRFMGNWATSGGGAIGMADCAGDVTSCAFAFNRAETSSSSRPGGAVECFRSPIAFTNCSFFGNTATSDGGGVRAQADNANQSPTFTNCLFWLNSDRDGVDQDAQVRLDDAAVANISYCDVQGWTGSLGGVGNFGADPQLVDPDGPDDEPGTADDDLRLGAGSPCVDAGDSGALPPGELWDAIGGVRLVDDPDVIDTGIASGAGIVIDVGALERGGDVTCEGDLNGDNVVDLEDLALLLANFGADSATYADGDITGDSRVNLADLAALLAELGRRCPLM